MRKLYYLFGVLLFISCKKEQDSKDEISYRKFDTIQSWCGSYNIFKANYNGDKLISLMGQGASTRNYYYVYNSAGQLVQRDVETSAGRQKATEYTYNSAGQLIEKKDLLPVCLNGSEYHKYIFAYDKGKLVQATDYLKNNTLSDYTFQIRRVYSWSGDNLSTVTAYDQNNIKYIDSLIFTYDMTKANPMQIFKDFWIQDLYDNPSTIFYLLSKNLMTKMNIQSFDCFINYSYDNSFNETRIKSLSPTCLSSPWVFTYSQ